MIHFIFISSLLIHPNEDCHRNSDEIDHPTNESILVYVS